MGVLFTIQIQLVRRLVHEWEQSSIPHKIALYLVLVSLPTLSDPFAVRMYIGVYIYIPNLGMANPPLYIAGTLHFSFLRHISHFKVYNCCNVFAS